jgi:choline dehydrogenase-like flavoprotein
MIVDSGALPRNEGVAFDVCIVGSGPAGTTLARELGRGRLRVCLIESGTFELADAATRTLSELDSDGKFVQVNPDQRNRRFGGNAGFWGVNLKHTSHGVRLIPFTHSDFDRREGVPHSGWPFGRELLEPYYARAQAALGAGPYSYELDKWTGPQTPALPFRGDSLQTSMFMFGDGDVITRDARAELERSPNVTVFCSSNVVELETDELGEQVERVQVATVDGNRFWVDAKMVVLAAGGVENAHLLLVSDKVHKRGIGNRHDLVGRFFMDHPIAHGGYIFPKSRKLFERTALYDKRDLPSASVMGGLLLSDDIVRKQGLLNLTSWLFPRPLWAARRDAMEALRRLARGKSLQQGAKAALQDAKSALHGGSAVADGIVNKLLRSPTPVWPNLATGNWSGLQENKPRVFGVFEVLHLLEQAPDPENRLTLGAGRDVLGRRKAYLHSRWREIDQRGVDRGQAILDRELRAAGLGHFEAERPHGQMLWSSNGASHHMGTTRMSQSAQHGVVDENCKVHGVHNLFVAGSAVFPTGSSLNPTLTIVALSARIADRVRLLLEREVAIDSAVAASVAGAGAVQPPAPTPARKPEPVSG